MVLRVLGICPTHNATATLLIDGVVVGIVSEERFSRIKNHSGFPHRAIEWLLTTNNLSLSDIDSFAFTGAHTFLAGIANVVTSTTGRNLLGFAAQAYDYAEYKAGKRYKILKNVKRVVWERSAGSASKKRFLREAVSYGIPETKIRFVDHHTCHAYSAYYGLSEQREKALVLTLDGEGDEAAATVSVFDGYTVTEIARTPKEASIGYVYSLTTAFLGMKPLEHEYKVMGLAPYASQKGEKYYLKTYERVFKDVVSLSSKNPLVFDGKVPTNRFGRYLRDRAVGERFDNIAGALQHLTETVVSDWVRACVKKTGITTVYAAGGVFMNVKMNLVLSKIPDVKVLHILPSCGDESAPLGAAYHEHIALMRARDQSPSTTPITHLYLGPDYDSLVSEYIQQSHLESRYLIRNATPQLVARLLADGEIIARCAGPQEFGARSLGNRCIMAHPSRLETVWAINDQIKMRDFWMPFAPSIIEERAVDYCVGVKDTYAPYMILAFEGTPLAKQELRGALHQADFTLRPQMVRESWNPRYYAIIKEFEKLTGIGGVLNTSFNLHGKPIVSTPEDAIEEVFEHSGLNHVILGDLLLTKK